MKEYLPIVHFISLGCAKNLVDSEVMLGLLQEKGWQPSPREKATVAIINTCAFIEEAKRESLATIGRLAAAKEKGKFQFLVVAGCLPQRYKSELAKELPEIDLFLGPGDIPRVAELLSELMERKLAKREFISRPTYLYDHQTPRLVSTSPGSAYVKIAEGCANFCSYCIIPQIRGRLRSRHPHSVVREVQILISQGVQEINLIAQDITNYGRDHRDGRGLLDLLKKLVKINGLKWIRLLYAHPAHLDQDLLCFIKEEEKVCKYLDLPLQHIDDHILRAMNRPYSSAMVHALLEKIKKEIPEITLRTSLIVGFPGETERRFQRLIAFVKEAQFDHLGVFRYSREEGTKAAHLPGQIPEKIKEERYHQIMRLQRQISWRKQKEKIGSRLEVLIERPGRRAGILWEGRTQGQAPEVDGLTFLQKGEARPGEIRRVRITKATFYDLYGEILDLP